MKSFYSIIFIKSKKTIIINTINIKSVRLIQKSKQYSTSPLQKTSKKYKDFMASPTIFASISKTFQQ